MFSLPFGSKNFSISLLYLNSNFIGLYLKNMVDMAYVILWNLLKFLLWPNSRSTCAYFFHMYSKMCRKRWCVLFFGIEFPLSYYVYYTQWRPENLKNIINKFQAMKMCVYYMYICEYNICTCMLYMYVCIYVHIIDINSNISSIAQQGREVPQIPVTFCGEGRDNNCFKAFGSKKQEENLRFFLQPDLPGSHPAASPPGWPHQCSHTHIKTAFR